MFHLIMKFRSLSDIIGSPPFSKIFLRCATQSQTQLLLKNGFDIFHIKETMDRRVLEETPV